MSGNSGDGRRIGGGSGLYSAADAGRDRFLCRLAVFKDPLGGGQRRVRRFKGFDPLGEFRASRLRFCVRLRSHAGKGDLELVT